MALISSAHADILVAYNLNNAVDLGGVGMVATALPSGGNAANAGNMVTFNGQSLGNESIVAGAGGGSGNFAVQFNSVGNNPSLAFNLNSSGYSFLTLEFDYLSTGPRDAILSLSIAGQPSILLGSDGITGTPFTITSEASGFQHYSVAIPSAVSNRPTTTFTISQIDNGSGAFAFDNISIGGFLTPIPEPTEIALPLFGLFVGGIWLYRRQKGASANAVSAA